MSESAGLEIKDDEYRVCYNPETATVTFQGELQLNGMNEYAPIMTLLDEVVKQAPSVLTLDLRQLEFLNSSGVNVLLSLVIKLRDKKTIQLIVEGSEAVSWQSRSLNNIRRLMPTAQLNIT
ncbi:SiaC family regulatory phosphoprotein [Trichocoleus sp. DQ-U1]|uniref:SiaC family regulatory phosphoprotein n=1 Tax=Trichocoleus sp. DQ-U1 TaxID=2933926 RepID=UPI003298E489